MPFATAAARGRLPFRPCMDACAGREGALRMAGRTPAPAAQEAGTEAETEA